MNEANLPRWLAWHALVVVALLGLVASRYGGPVWQLSPERLLFAILLAGGYLTGAAVLHLDPPKTSPMGLIGVARALLAGYAIPFFAVIAMDAPVSRFALGVGFLSAGLALAAPFLVPRLRTVGFVVLAPISLGLLYMTSTSGFTLTQPRVRSVAVSQIVTSLVSVEATLYRNYLPRSESPYAGGGIAAVGDGHVIVTADGDVHRVTWAANGEPQIETLPTRAPLDRSGFRALTGNGDFTQWFRVFDVATRGEGDAAELYVSYHAWNDDEGCFVVRLARLEGSVAEMLQGTSAASWDLVFESQPCLYPDMTQPADPFGGMAGGGRIAFVDDSTMLLTVGDQGFTGVRFKPDVTQDPTTDYGKTLLIDLATGDTEVYSTGHRNAQGLWIDDDGAIWLTEHGPAGGDELNRIQRGSNYGWPIVTYGTEYGLTEWPLNPRQGQHEGYAKPAFAWVPSVGISDLLRVRGAAFSGWQGDLLVTSMGGMAIWRVRTEGDRVVVTEPIGLGDRIRDLTETADGNFVLLTDSYSLMVLEPIDLPYATCAGCHGLTPEAGAALGPSLSGVLGRRVADDPNFPYSAALRGLGGEWTARRLDEFLTDPQAFAPGTTMLLPGLTDPARRQAIIQYLANQ